MALFLVGRSYAQQPSPPLLQLSLAAAVAQAMERNPLPVSAKARLRGTIARLSGAARQPNPTLSLARPFGSPNTGGFGEDVIAAQSLDLPDKVRFRKQSARAEAEAALADRNGVDADLILSVRVAYYEALRADVEVVQANALLSATRRFADAAQTQYVAGDVSRSNIVRSLVEVSRAEQTLLAAETDRANRYATLRSLIGLPEPTPLQLTDALIYTPKEYELSRLIALAAKTRQDVVSARRLVAARTADVRGAKVQGQPDLILEGRHAKLFGGDNTTPPGDSVRVGVVFPLFDYGRIRAEVNSMKSQQEEQEANLREAERVARLEIETVFRERTLAERVVESFEKGRLKRANEILEMVNIGYANGANSYLEVIDAQQIYQTEQVEYARAIAAVNIATCRLERAVGGKLP